MRKATIRIRRDTEKALEQMGRRFVKHWKSGRATEDTLEFESPAALFLVLTPKRWALVERLQQNGPTSIRRLARDLERDVKRVHGDVRTLMGHGIIARGDDGNIRVPYDVIHAEFDLHSVA